MLKPSLPAVTVGVLGLLLVVVLVLQFQLALQDADLFVEALHCGRGFGGLGRNRAGLRSGPMRLAPGPPWKKQSGDEGVAAAGKAAARIMLGRDGNILDS